MFMFLDREKKFNAVLHLNDMLKRGGELWGKVGRKNNQLEALARAFAGNSRLTKDRCFRVYIGLLEELNSWQGVVWMQHLANEALRVRFDENRQRAERVYAELDMLIMDVAETQYTRGVCDAFDGHFDMPANGILGFGC